MTTASVSDRPLTQKQESFCLFIFQGLSQRDAYVKAGYSARGGLAVVDTEASILLDSPKISKRINDLRQKAADAAVGTVLERAKRLTEIYRANLTDFVDADGNITLKPSAAIAEFTTEEIIVDSEASLSKRVKRLKLRDPIAAIEAQNKMERVGQPDTAININNDNRSVTIVVKSEEGKAALGQLRSGKLPQSQSAQSAHLPIIDGQLLDSEANS